MGYLRENQGFYIDCLVEQLRAYPELADKIRDRKQELLRKDRSFKKFRTKSQFIAEQDKALIIWENDTYLNRLIKIKVDIEELLASIDGTKTKILKGYLFQSQRWSAVCKQIENYTSDELSDMYWDLLELYAEIDKDWIAADKRRRNPD